MNGIRIDEFKIQLLTVDGEYGFDCQFSSGLNILRGNNSSGKSTFINALVYSLGMEELIGGKGNKTLPYSLKDYLEENDKNKIKIISSYVYVEVTNSKKETITLKRPVFSDGKDTKLVEVIQGAYLSNGNNNYPIIPTFLHDAGSAQDDNSGFFKYFERFIGLQLPKAAGIKGGEVKLFLQTVFSAMFVEQKRGWTDYIASTPYYAIRDVKTKIVEFILGLEVFENERKKISIQSEISELQRKWANERTLFKLALENNNINISGVSEKIDDSFDGNLVNVEILYDSNLVKISSYITTLLEKIESIDKKVDCFDDDASKKLINKYSNAKSELDKLLVLLDTINSDIRVAESRLKQYEATKLGIEKDLKKNKIALKLKKFGAEQGLEIAKDICPSCHQKTNDSLLLADTFVKPMTLDENIKYLDSQKKMMARYISGLVQSIDRLKAQSSLLLDDASDKRALCMSIKKDIRRLDTISESDIKLKIQLEMKIEKVVKSEESINKSIDTLFDISKEYQKLKKKLSSIPVKNISEEDQIIVRSFQSCFRELARTFDYRSAPIDDIEINYGTLFPYLSEIELREINTDIKSDSSASDFVRLIWAYLLSLYITSNKYSGNHLGVFILDEPAQHSMGVSSMNALLKALSSQQSSLQSIVSASFDEDDQVFSGSVEGVEYKLISVGDKLLKKIEKVY